MDSRQEDFERHRRALRRHFDPETCDNIIEYYNNVPVASYSPAEDLPDTPVTTMSAVMGPGPALDQESTTRAAAAHLHAEAQARIHDREMQHANTKQDKERTGKAPFSLKKALKSLTPTKKKSNDRANEQTKVYPGDQSKEESEDAYDQCRGTFVKRYHPTFTRTVPGPSFPQQFSTQSLPTPTDNPYSQYHTVQPGQQMFGFDTPLPQSPAHLLQPTAKQSSSPSAPEDYSMTLGGQIPHPGTQRLPSTFLTPTNTDTYAVSGRSHLVSGHPITSHHADIHSTTCRPLETTSSAPNTTTITNVENMSTRPMFINKPVVKFATHATDVSSTSSDDDAHVTKYEDIPGVPFTFEHLDARLKHPEHRTAAQGRPQPFFQEMRRSASVPADMMVRASALPEPLSIKKTPVAVLPAPLSSQIKDDYVVAAFDGVHKHLEDVKGELLGRMARVEEKMERVLAALAGGAAVGGVVVAAKKKQQQQQQQQQPARQQREIRGNLTGLPPHIPFGGMEGWYDAQK